ncbi:hypothetical protein [Oligoflexus tunisiensis]|uniref:hypothetical protein n=1 Tax=Oligoflexus tunisiensis TaxID=708132 RepID=UPI00114C875B|nr:hypothetical protein [Oligoflexus tunisiensis]
MDSKKLSRLAASMAGLILASQAQADMDVHTTKGKDGKDYFCANAKCAGNSSCMGAGNSKCGSQNKCAKTEQGYLTGWFFAEDKETCEKGTGKWMLYKKEYGFKTGNRPPFGTTKAKDTTKTETKK